MIAILGTGSIAHSHINAIRCAGKKVSLVEKGKEVMMNFANMLSEYGNVEKNPQLEGRNMSLTISPKTEKEKAAMAKKAQEE